MSRPINYHDSHRDWAASIARAAVASDVVMNPLLVPRAQPERRRKPSLVDVTLDPAQRAAIALAPSRALLVLGEAGHGKTTVALHRVAAVSRGARLRAAVVVPTEGLARLLQPLARRLGIDADVVTYDRFASTQARRAFRRLPRESDEAPPSVMRVKRSGAVGIALEEIARRDAARVDDEAPSRRTRAHATRDDLLQLFGDRVLVERVAHAASIPTRAVDDVLERTHVQFSATAEEEFSHVIDRERLVAVDRRALDDGTASANATTIDVEDYAVLFEIDRLRAERLAAPPIAPRAWDVLAIDEAQELAPLELALLGRSLAPGGALVVAGDADQQTDESSDFTSWQDVMRALGRPDHEAVTLDVGYRCSPEVASLARAIRRGEPPAPVHLFDDERALAVALGAEIAALLDRDPRASVAVVCRTPATAQRWGRHLKARAPTRVVFDGRFLPRGPVQVSTHEEVKGLEFDYVIVPDTHAYDAAPRALYVAVTRARHQALLADAGEVRRLDGRVSTSKDRHR
jgi:superfamily I DNA/RNA helicase